MRKLLLPAACFVLLFSTNLFADMDFGAQINWNKFPDVSGDWGIGARLEIGSEWRFVSSFDYYFVDVDIFGRKDIEGNDFNLKFYEINGDIAYYGATVPWKPYAAAGISISKRTFDNVKLSNFFKDSRTELGINVVGGVKFSSDSPIQPFFEVRGVFYPGDETFNNRFVLTGGFVF